VRAAAGEGEGPASEEAGGSTAAGCSCHGRATRLPGALVEPALSAAAIIVCMRCAVRPGASAWGLRESSARVTTRRGDMPRLSRLFGTK
jgi:hypothetical protein